MAGQNSIPNGVTFAAVRQIVLALPDVEESTSYGTPAFRVRKKLLARLREDGETLVVMISVMEQQSLINLEPDVYFLTDHYVGYAVVLVRLPMVQPDSLRELLERAWRNVAPKRLIAAQESAQRGDE